MSYSKSLKKRKEKNSPLCPLNCRHGHRQISTLGLHIAMATHNCGISSRSGSHIHVFSLTNPCHSLISCTIFLVCMTPKPLFLKQSFTVSIHIFHGLPTEQLSYIDSLRNLIILHLHMVEPPENNFINPFVYPLRHSAQLPYSCI